MVQVMVRVLLNVHILVSVIKLGVSTIPRRSLLYQESPDFCLWHIWGVSILPRDSKQPRGSPGYQQLKFTNYSSVLLILDSWNGGSLRTNPKNAVTLFAMLMLIECPFKEGISIFAFLNHFSKVRSVSEQFGEKALSSLIQKSLCH